MRPNVVEGEPGIFPDPIARSLRAICRRMSAILSRERAADRDDEAPPSSSGPR